MRTGANCITIVGIISTFLILGCTSKSDKARKVAQEEKSAEASRPEIGTWGFDMAGMDKSVRPGDDFYTYANGTWHKNATIAEDKPATSPMSSLQDKALDELKQLIDELVQDKDVADGSEKQKIRDWYLTLLDESKLESLDLAPLKDDFSKIKNLKSTSDLADLLADNHSELGITPLSVGFAFDRKTENKAVVAINTSGLALPREIYLEPAYEPIRKIYLQHLASVFTLLNESSPEAKAKNVLNVETEIAKITWPLEDKRDPRKLYNPTDVKKLSSMAPGLDWKRFIKRAGYGTPSSVIVTTASSITGMAKLIKKLPITKWKDYLEYNLVRSAQVQLPKKYRDAFFAFYGKILGGQQQPDPRWKEAIIDLGWSGRPFADPLGHLYLKAFVPEESRPRLQKIVGNILKAFDDRLKKLPWMTESTRIEAREKLAKTTIKVVYPELWKDVDGLTVERGDAIGNLRRAIKFLRDQDISYVSNLPDRRIFLKSIYEVNAYANPPWNEIVFLAGIARPPAFDPNADLAVNYGAMGAVIGHEISHLFDDQGRLSDGNGLLRDWWTKEDADKFVAVANRLSKQVSAYEPLPGKHINGKLTLGESLADVAGLLVSYDAYKLAMNGKSAPAIDGYTDDQRFFLAYAQMWRFKPRDAYLDRLLKTDFHPPTNFRPYTVRNIDAWYDAFDIKPGDKLYLPPEERVQPW